MKITVAFTESERAAAERAVNLLRGIIPGRVKLTEGETHKHYYITTRKGEQALYLEISDKIWYNYYNNEYRPLCA